LQTHSPVDPIPTTSSTVVSRAATTDHLQATAYAAIRANSARLVQAIYLVFGAIEGLLLIRFFLAALGANAEPGFAQAIYAVAGLLLAPFVGWLLARAAWLILGESRSNTVASVSGEQTRVG
jgi:hypothetical protein